jgi:hypothetical protein
MHVALAKKSHTALNYSTVMFSQRLPDKVLCFQRQLRQGLASGQCVLRKELEVEQPGPCS